MNAKDSFKLLIINLVVFCCVAWAWPPIGVAAIIFAPLVAFFVGRRSTYQDDISFADDRERFQQFLKSQLEPTGEIVPFSRDKAGQYHALYARRAWALWVQAQKQE